MKPFFMCIGVIIVVEIFNTRKLILCLCFFVLLLWSFEVLE